MRVIRLVVSTLGAWGALASYACVGSDPAPTPSDPAGSEAGGPAFAEAGDGATTSSAADGSDSADGEAGTPAEAGPTCGRTPATCVDAFNGHRENDCNPALQACFNGCGSLSNPCASGCKNNFITCMQGYQKTCIDCGKGASACDPYTDCAFAPP